MENTFIQRGAGKNMRRTMHMANTKDPIVARITDMLIKEGKSQKTLMDYLETYRMLISDLKVRRANSCKQYIDQITQFLDVSLTCLLKREESHIHLKYEDDERELIRLYLLLNAIRKI